MQTAASDIVKTNKVSVFVKILYIILLYCVLFYPPIVVGGHRVYGYQFVRIIAFLYLFFNIGQFKSFCKVFKTEISLFIIIIGYSAIRALLSGQLETAISNIIGLFTLLIIPFFLVDFGTRRMDIDSVGKLTRYLTLTTTIAIAISIIAFLVPQVNSFIRETLIQYEGNGGNFQRTFEERGFGWGLYMTSSYAFIIGMVSALGLFYHNYNKWCILIIPFAFAACLLNARTGVVILLAGILISFLFSKKISYTIVILAIGLIIYLNLDAILDKLAFNNAMSYQWIMEGFLEVGDYLEGDYSSGTMYNLAKGVHFPNNILGWIIGEGESLFVKNSFGVHSDIGFINQLFFGGLVYCFMLYSLVFRVCRRMVYYKQTVLALFIIAVFVIINFKGEFVFNTPEMGLTMLLYYTIVINSRKSGAKYNTQRI